jgi:hypothetical protein
MPEVAAATPAPTPAPSNGRRRRAAVRALQVLLGLAAGAAIAEVAFTIRDRGAFPHLNVYTADARLGVRLRPGAMERVAFNGNPVTQVRIGLEGFRGAGLPPPAPGDVVVVGDSQVFGLGVEEEETFSAELERRLPGRRVLDLGVPTYGPPEYNAVLEDLLPSRASSGDPATTVVYTVNLANDLFEADRRNVDRHAVWDGWAVRSETAPERIVDFPGRALLFRESHAVFALRALLHRSDASADAGFASEGTWQDLLGAAARIKTGGSAALAALVKQELEAQQKLETVATGSYPDLMNSKEGREYRRTHGSPEDIVVKTREHKAVEGGRAHDVTVSHLIEGAKIRRRIEGSLRKRAEKEIDQERARAVLASLQEREAIQKRIEALQAAAAQTAEALSPLRRPLARAKAICEASGARMVVLVLPIDVAVSPAEWAKYGKAPIEMGDVEVLAKDVLATAASLGIEALDATPALAAAEPGAFLHADIHMTPKGHRAVAAALAEVVGRQTPPHTDAKPRAARQRKGR